MSEKMDQVAEQELLFLMDQNDVPYDWSVGKYGSKFLLELRDNKRMVGAKCPQCGRVYVPPRKVCGNCYVAMTEMVPVSNEGDVLAACVVRFYFVDPETGKQKPVPYGNVFVRPDGADTAISHFMEVNCPEDEQYIKVGQRVRAVYAEDRVGSLTDIRFFEPIK